MPWTRACSRHSPLPIRRSAHRPFRPVLESLEDRCLPTTFLVTNTGDNGAGSLRQAILDANATAGTDTIAFSIAGAGAHTIQPTSSLPTITDPAVIDATTQPGYAGTPIVEIDGSMAGAGVNGLVITAGSSTIRGLVINRFDVTGINLAGGGGNRIERNYIGTDVTGTLNRGNGGNGIGVFSPNNTIANNLISGNAGIGVLLRGVGTNQNVVAGNYVGTNAVGTAALANGGSGVQIDGGASNNRIGTDGNGTADAAERNIISGNTVNGITISNVASRQNLVAGNYIGTNAAGTAALPNSNGIILQNSAQANRIGADGHDANPLAEGNLISGNTFNGIGLFGASLNVVAGNYIGTDASGTAALGNGQRGVLLIGGVQSNNRIGTDGDGVGDAAERNVISGNGFSFGGGWSGVEINGTGSTSNVVAGNYIGINSAGTAALRNAGNGVGIFSGAQANIIGTNGDGVNDSVEGNVIAFNTHAGVAVRDTTTTGNSIRGNSIYSNGGLGIDLGNNGVSANDPLDADTGPNNFQNFPVLTAAVPGASTSIAGTLNSLPNTTFVLDFYASTTADPSGYGEGQRYLGFITVTTDGSGNASFSTILAATTSLGEVISATATDPSGNTSEMAAVVTARVATSSAQGIGYWKNHPSAWSNVTLQIGGVTYSQSQLLGILSLPAHGNALVIVLDQLIAAKLNIQVFGVFPGPTTQAAITDADAALASLTQAGFLAANTGLLYADTFRSAFVASSSTLGQELLADADILDAFNNPGDG